MAFTSRILRVQGIDLHTIVEGEGPAVLLVHGFPDDHHVWRHQIPALVAAGYRVIAPDLRGCGESDAPRRTRAYALDTLVADLVGVLDALGVTKASVIGHDLGAVLGWQLAMRHPERVTRFVALSVGHPNAYALAPLEQKLKGYYVALFQLRGLAELWLRSAGWWWLRKLTGHAEASRWIARLSRPGRLTAAIDYYRANLRIVLPRAYPPVTVPVLGIWSDGDRFLVERQMIDSAKWTKAPFRYERLEGASHWLQLDAPERVNPLVLGFLRPSSLEPLPVSP